MKKPTPEAPKTVALRAAIADRVKRLDDLDNQIGALIQRAADVMKAARPGCRISLLPLPDLGAVVWGKHNGTWQFVWVSPASEEMPLLSAPRHVRLAFTPRLDEEFLLTRTLEALDEEIKNREEVVK